jgi:hypothetical protein
MLLRAPGSARHCVTAVCGTFAVQTVRVGPTGDKFGKCASFPESADRTSYRPVFAIVSTIHVVVAKPPIAVALRGARMPEMFDRSWTSRFRRKTESSRSGKWAASVRCATARCVAGLCATKRFRAGTFSQKYFNASGWWSTRSTVMLLRASGCI